MDSKVISIETNSLITFAEAAIMLSVSRPTIYNRVKEGHLHPIKLGNNQYLLRADIEVLKTKS